nr:hypothetical protein GCM10025732_47050 [Glycomyces mayteni]
MRDERLAEGAAGAEQEREDPFWQAVCLERVADRVADELRRLRMRLMGFDDHGRPGGQRGGGVASGRGEREREVAGAEHGDGPERNVPQPQVGVARCGAWPVPGLVFEEAGEHAELV